MRPERSHRVGRVERRELPAALQPKSVAARDHRDADDPRRVGAVRHERRDEQPGLAVDLDRLGLSHDHAGPEPAARVVVAATDVDEREPVEQTTKVIVVDEINRPVLGRVRERAMAGDLDVRRRAAADVVELLPALEQREPVANSGPRVRDWLTFRQPGDEEILTALDALERGIVGVEVGARGGVASGVEREARAGAQQ